MKKQKPRQSAKDLRLDPESRLCPLFDPMSIKKYDLPSHTMGFRVVDNCAEENVK